MDVHRLFNLPSHWAASTRRNGDEKRLWRLRHNTGNVLQNCILKGRYWGNSGHWPEPALNGSVANDPKRKWVCVAAM